MSTLMVVDKRMNDVTGMLQGFGVSGSDLVFILEVANESLKSCDNAGFVHLSRVTGLPAPALKTLRDKLGIAMREI